MSKHIFKLTNQKTVFVQFIIFSVNIILIIIINIIDRKIFGPDFTLTLLYFIPILISIWYGNIFFTILLCFLTIVSIIIVKSNKPEILKNINFYIDIFVKATMYIVLTSTFYRLKKSLELEKNISRKDHLTGALNRKGFFEALDMEIYKANRNNYQLTLAFIDVDNFKKINDIYGHSRGDKLLKKVISIISNNIRKSDIISRIGGDEFVIIFPNLNRKNAEKIFLKLMENVNKYMEYKKYPSSLSIGVGIFNKINYKPDKIINIIDELMYSAKKKSKSNIIYKEIS